MTVSYRRQTVFVFLPPQVSGLMPNTYLVHEHKLERGSPRLDHKSCSPVRPTTVFCLIVLLITYTSSSYKKKKRRDIYRETSTTMFALSCCAVADCLALLANLAFAFAFALCFRGIKIADLFNHVLVQPNEHHALNLTRKHSACLLYTSPSPRDGLLSRMPSSA